MPIKKTINENPLRAKLLKDIKVAPLWSITLSDEICRELEAMKKIKLIRNPTKKEGGDFNNLPYCYILYKAKVKIEVKDHWEELVYI
jgi:hypothetical protein